MNGEAWVAGTDYQGLRLIVRRTKRHEPRPALYPDYRYHVLMSDHEGDALFHDVANRHHAVVELNIRDLKENTGLEHVGESRRRAKTSVASIDQEQR